MYVSIGNCLFAFISAFIVLTVFISAGLHWWWTSLLLEPSCHPRRRPHMKLHWFFTRVQQSCQDIHTAAVVLVASWIHPMYLFIEKNVHRDIYLLGPRPPQKKQNRGLWACEKHTEIQNKAIGSTHFSFFTKTKKKQTIKLWERWSRWD